MKLISVLKACEGHIRGHGWTNRRTQESGRIVAMVPAASLAAMVCVGIGVDFSGQALAEQDLRDKAGFCARQGAQEILVEAATTLSSVATTYECLSEQELMGTVTITGTAVVVEATSTYRTRLLTIIAINELPVRATGSASILQGR